MAKLIKIVNYAYIKEEVDLPNSLEDDQLDHKVYRAQEMARMLMGDQFWQAYVAWFVAGKAPGVYLTLYPYVKQYIAWQTNEYYTIKANTLSTRSGFRIHSETNSVAASDVQMATLIKDAKQQAQYYKTLLVDYLNGHSADFPLYNVSCGTSNLKGNTFHISAVKNKHRHDHNCKCGCNSHRI